MTDIITGDRLILAIGNMSFNGMMIILGILALRWIMIKTFPDLPRKYIVCLWAIPFFRLLCPLDLSHWLGRFSLLPWNGTPLEVVNGRGMENALYPGVHPQIDTGFIPVDQWMNETMVSSIPEPVEVTSIDPFQITQYFLFLIWLTGAIALLLITVWSWWKLTRSVSNATLYRRERETDMLAPDLVTQIQTRNIKIYESDRISTAFVVGWIRYRIYLPAGLTDEEADCVLLHELAHIRRNDPFWKLAAYIAVILHWFNPMVWAAYKTLIRDIEMACDEKALKDADPRKYTNALLKLSMRGSGLLTPLAFGEGRIKERIVNALNVKEPRKIVCVAAVVIIAMAAVACASNKSGDLERPWDDAQESSAIVIDSTLNETARFTEEELHLAVDVLEYRTENKKDQDMMLGLIQIMDWGDAIEINKVNFQTNARPYEIQLWFQLKEGIDPKQAVIDQAKIAMNGWLVLSQTEDIDAVAVTVAMEEEEPYAYYQVICERDTIEIVNAEALSHIVSIAQNPPLHEGSTLYAGEPTLWELGGDPETLLLLIRSLNVARGVQEDVLFGSAKDPGVAMLLPNLPVLPVTDEEGNMSHLAVAATQQMITYIENLPYEIAQHELREQGFVTSLFGNISDNLNRWNYFLDRYCEGFPEEPVGYPKFDSSGTGLGFSREDFLWSEEENGAEKGETVAAGKLIPNGGGLGDDVMLYAQATKEGDWILLGILAYEDGFVMIRDISRDEYRDVRSAEYSVRMFDHLVYKEGEPAGDIVDYTILLADQSSEEFTFETLPEIHWELYSGYRPK
ncbi:MAG: M56 family metallopeptidase [Firmicutes bacterium]|nr:M56 family metallopeptidase [Bacillota bacterium]